MARTVLLHVGAPKTGTSAIQQVLGEHRHYLQAQGICYPGERFDAHFLAALELMQLPWGGLEREAHGAWRDLVAQVRDWEGTAIISHEILAAASRPQIAQALTDLGYHDGTELHVIYSARDLARQIPAEWQENIKHRRTTGLMEFIDALQAPTRSDDMAQWFWGVQEVPNVLDRWGEFLPAQQVHLVTVPPAGTPAQVLRDRMSQALQLDLDEVAQADPDPDVLVEPPRINRSLGVAEAAVLRQLNHRLEPLLENHHYRALVREELVHHHLSRQRSSAPLSIPSPVFDWSRDLSQVWVEQISARGYHIIGDLQELIPRDHIEFVDPAAISDAQLAQATMRALQAMTLEGRRLREREQILVTEVEDLHREVKRAHSTPIYRVKQQLVGLASTNRLARWGLNVYRRLTGRSS